ncbi:MAG: copper resistance protein NlpE N-terminal domain-containing protein [Flavobacteriaceae bacterium]|nr:copper resistance protein NlpE N-terminal domain-containing protein [Flavobacteriaceae bacterium]
MPCADCEGIKTELILHKDLTFEIGRKYVGKGDEIFKSKGTFTWNKAGSIVTLNTENEDAKHNQYQVGENRLIKLDAEGKKIDGKLAEMYVLTKNEFDQKITDKYWKLVELRGQKNSHSGNRSQRGSFCFELLKAARIHGNGGCNVFNGTYELTEGNRIQFSKMASTMMACPNDTTETEFMKIFEMADNYSIQGETLSLNKARMAPLAKFEVVYLK